MRKKQPGIFWTAVISAVLLALGLAGFLQVALSTPKASQSFLELNRFVGSYSYDGFHWQQITPQSMPSAMHERVMLRGHFTEEIPAGYRLYYYRDHISISVYRDDECILSNKDTLLTEQGPQRLTDLCGREWMFIVSPGLTPEDTVDNNLRKRQFYSNESAYREFLTTTYISDGSANALESMLQNRSFLPQAAGVVLCVVSLMLFGVTVASRLLHIRTGLHLTAYAFAALFAGAFLIVDIIDINFWSTSIASSTYLWQLSMMLATYFTQLLLRDLLTGTRRRIVSVTLVCSAVIDGVLVLLSICRVMLIYDTQPYWSLSQLVLCPLLLVCGTHELICNAKHRHYEALHAILLPVAVLLDILHVWESAYSSANCTRVAISITFTYYTVRTIHYVVVNRSAVVRVAQLENELAESRISIMLSQLQPHFMYNVLNSIYYLCKHDPLTARDMVDKFSDYLRNNMASLEKKGLIPFREEYQHVQTYLSLEQLRFQKQLELVEDIETTHFRLPPLTLQPLVENAVRHGVTKKKGGGTVTISTRETASTYLVTVHDTGNGFDPEHYTDDGKVHIGIRNVRERLERMVGGTLTIESTPETGTTATILIPKKEGMLI